MILALILALSAALLVLASEWYAYDGRRLERPQEGAYAPAEVWAAEVEASLTPDPADVLVSHGVIADPWAMPPALRVALMAAGTSLAAIPTGAPQTGFLG